MARRGPALSIEADLSDGYGVAGFITGMTTEIKTDRYIGSVLSMAHSEMAEQFDLEMDVKAMGNPSALHHVYEWRLLGQAQGRLWRHNLVGRGNNREATFSWMASKAPILTPEERQSDPLRINDPMQGVDLSELKLKDRSYIFYWKAPMMEFDLTARVRPKYAKRLFVPTWRAKGNYRFVDETYQDFSKANPQDGSGGPGTVGRFTAVWLEWWNGSAPGLWDREVRKVIENDLGLTAREITRTGKAKTKRFGLSVFNAQGADSTADNFAAYEAGKNRAIALVRGKAESYAKANKYIERYGRYGGDIEYGDF